jgi:hypothetical protein
MADFSSTFRLDQVRQGGLIDPGAPRSHHSDHDGAASWVNCDDSDAARHPGASEICDGKDNYCDLVVPAGESDAEAHRLIVRVEEQQKRVVYDPPLMRISRKSPPGSINRSAAAADRGSRGMQQAAAAFSEANHQHKEVAR